MKKIILVLLIIAGVVALSLYRQVGQEEQGKEVQLFAPKLQAIEATVLATGKLEFLEEELIYPQINARVKAVLVKEGDQVNKGQELVRLDDEDLRYSLKNAEIAVTLKQLEIKGAQIQLASLQQDLQRQQRLLASNASQAVMIDNLKNQLDQTQLQIDTHQQLLQQAELNVEQIRNNLLDTVMVAGRDGIVSVLNVEEGEMAMSNGAMEPMIKVADPKALVSEVNVDEADIGKVSVDQQATLYAVAYLDDALSGRVTRIATSARSLPGKNSLVFPVEVEVEAQRPEGVILRPGMSTRVELFQRSDRQYWVVPLEAVVESESGQHQLFVMESGLAHAIKVELGPEDDQYVAILSGLEEQHRVVAGPYRVLRSLKEGDALVEQQHD